MILKISSFRFDFEFNNTKIEFLNTGWKSVTGTGLKSPIYEENEIEQNLTKIFIHSR